MKSINIDKNYLVPMSKLDGLENNEELVSCNISLGSTKQCIKCYKDGYRTKYFHSNYFEYLLSTGYINVVE